jgi:hypothetical protein
MSESSTESDGNVHDTPEQGLISDEQLPDDLRPDKNPMAQEPDDDPDGFAPGAEAGSGDAAAGGTAGPPA